MFMFYEIALIPMYLLIGVWGTGKKEYAAMKLTLMLMGGSALLLVGILGIYFNSGATSMNILTLRVSIFRTNCNGGSSRLPLSVLVYWELSFLSTPGVPTVMLQRPQRCRCFTPAC